MRKSVILCITIVMCLAAVAGSVAYFTDSISVQSEIKSGNLDIEQVEYERVTTSKGTYLKEYSQKQEIYPSMDLGDGEERQTETVATKDGTVSITAKLNQTIQGYVDKIVVSTNHGSLNTYIRTFVAVPTDFDRPDLKNPENSIKAIHLDWNKEGGWAQVDGPFVEWITVEDDGSEETIEYTIYYAVNEEILAPGESAAPSLLGFYLDSKVDHNGKAYTLNSKELGTDNGLKILVATQASQAIPTGIGERTTRAGAVESLNETYDEKDAQGNYTIIHHPWIPAKTNPPTETNP